MGYLIYFLCVTLSSVFLLPGIFLTLGGGFLFGLLKGSALFVLGQTLGASTAFLLGRKFLKSWATRYLLKHPKLGILNSTLADEGWKFIAILRMTPLFPFKISNYLFGAIGYPFSAFFHGTILGILPLSITMVYLGSLVQDYTDLKNQNVLGDPLASKVALISGALAVIGMVLISKRATRKYLELLRTSEKANLKS